MDPWYHLILLIILKIITLATLNYIGNSYDYIVFVLKQLTLILAITLLTLFPTFLFILLPFFILII